MDPTNVFWYRISGPKNFLLMRATSSVFLQSVRAFPGFEQKRKKMRKSIAFLQKILRNAKNPLLFPMVRIFMAVLCECIDVFE